MEHLIQDIRYGLRMLVNKPGFTFVAMLVLALGIGGNSAIFSVVNTVLLRSLPYENPDALVMLWGFNEKEGIDTDPISYLNVADWNTQNQSFEELAIMSPRWTFNLTNLEEPERISGMFTSTNLFPMLGVAPMHGRSFLPEEEQPGGEAVVIISYGFWQRAFGGTADVLEKTLTLDTRTYTIVGVMPAGFEFLSDVPLWLPMSADNPSMTRFMASRNIRLYHAVGRLKSDVTLEQAQAEISTIASQLALQYPQINTGMGARLLPLHEQVIGDVRSSLLLMFGAVGFVLLIACANVANLILTRTAVRQKEVAIRVALGAGRVRVIRQFLTESILLSLFGGIVGVVLAVWGVDAMLSLMPDAIPRQMDIRVDTNTLAFTFLIALFTGILFGLVPALQASRIDQQEALKEGGRGSQSSSTRFRNGLIVAEMALALVLLVGSGLLIRSFMQVLDVNPGFKTDHLLTMSAGLSRSVYGDTQQRIAFWQTMEDRIEALPGVTSVGAVTRIPLRGPNNNVTTTLSIESRPVPEGEKPEVDFRRASPEYFQTMGIPLMQGRDFTAQDTISSQPTVLINQALADRFFPGENPIGKKIDLGSNARPPWLTIVGVVGNVRHMSLDTPPRPEVYRHLMTNVPFGPIWAIRTSVDPASLIPAVRSLVHEMDRDLPISGITTMDELMATSVAQRRFAVQLLGLFAGVALVLAAVGIYGVMSYSVTQQTREIGLRIALGAEPRDILRQVVGRGMLLVSIGIGIGMVAAFMLTRLMTGFLYGITPTDPITYAGIVLLLACVALIANYLPARRAMRVDPMVALRYE